MPILPRHEGEFLLPSAAIDACLFACGVYLWYSDKNAIFIPYAIDSIRLRRPARPGEACMVRLNFRNREQNLGVFDFVLFGACSLGSEPDAIQLALSVDGVVLVVDHDRTRRDAARRSVDVLQAAQARVVGVVFRRRGSSPSSPWRPR